VTDLFIVTWLCAITYWKLSGERRWQLPQGAPSE
jgi:hypothetical protein